MDSRLPNIHHVKHLRQRVAIVFNTARPELIQDGKAVSGVASDS